MFTFLIVGLFFTIVVGLLFSLIITNNIKNIVLKWTCFIIVALSIGYLIAGAFSLQVKTDAILYNNGICRCGGNYVFF